MTIEEINKYNRNHMLSETRTDFEFEMEDKNLLDVIIKKFENLYPYSNDPKELIEDRSFLENINKFINNFNRKKISESEFITSLETELTELNRKFADLKYRYNYNIEYYKENLSHANRLLISGDGGIGKSYFIFKLEEKIKNLDIEHLCIYCKFTKKIPNNIVEQILKQKDEFYLIIDAFNELVEAEQKNMFEIIKRIQSLKNINIIITYRTNNLDENMKMQLEEVLKNKYIFNGVEYESSFTRIIEMYGVQATRFMDVLETNNPLYIKMLCEVLDNFGSSLFRVGNCKKRKK